MALPNPHGREKQLKPLLLPADEGREEARRAGSLRRLTITSGETSDLIMLGTGAFTPLGGFMGRADWRSVCDELQLSDGTFWPIPITLSTTPEEATGVKEGQEVALVGGKSGELMATLTVHEKYTVDRAHECTQIFGTTDPAHPGVATVMGQGEVNLAGLFVGSEAIALFDPNGKFVLVILANVSRIRDKDALVQKYLDVIQRRLAVRVLNASPRDNPLDSLIRDCRDPIEIRVIVQDDEARRFSRGGHDQVWNRQPMLATLRQCPLHLYCSIEYRLGQRNLTVRQPSSCVDS